MTRLLPRLPCPRQMSDLLSIHSWISLGVFIRAPGPRKCLEPAPLLPAHLAPGQICHRPPWLGTIPWAGAGSLYPTDTQVCQAYRVTQGFLRFLPRGCLSEGLLPHGSGKPKWMQGKIPAKQESLPSGTGCRGSWLSRPGVVIMPAPHVANGRLLPTPPFTFGHSFPPPQRTHTFMCSAPDLAPEVFAYTWDNPLLWPGLSGVPT